MGVYRLINKEVYIMNSNELRLGNYINWIRIDGNPIEVVSIYNIMRSTVRCCTTTIEELNEIQLYYSEIKPIPLTEQWLIKFGFENRDTRKWLYYKDCGTEYLVEYYKADNTFSFDMLVDGEFRTIIYDLEFVHILQNVWFALTGEELELKEKVI
jgi:hypothetical protein